MMGSLASQQHLGGRHDRSLWLCLVFILSVATVSADTKTDGTSMRRLRAKLFQNYDTNLRPVVNQRTLTQVSVGLSPLALMELDEEKQIMEMDTWLYMRWNDEHLVWDPQEYDGVTILNLPSTEVWRPDITIYTGTPAKRMIIEVLTHVIVNHTGDVLWVPPVTIRNRCPQEIETYPRDTLECIIRIGSWTYHEYKMDFQVLESQQKLEHFKNTNPNWELVSFTSERRSKYYSCCREPYPEIDYKVTLKRRSLGRASRKCIPAEQMGQLMRYHCALMPKSACDTGGSFF